MLHLHPSSKFSYTWEGQSPRLCGLRRVLFQDALGGPPAFTAGPQQQGWGHPGGWRPRASRLDLQGPWDAGHPGRWGSRGSAPPGGCSPLSRGRQSPRQDHQRGRARAFLPLPHLHGMVSAVNRLTVIAHAQGSLLLQPGIMLQSPIQRFMFGSRMSPFHLSCF